MTYLYHMPWVVWEVKYIWVYSLQNMKRVHLAESGLWNGRKCFQWCGKCRDQPSRRICKDRWSPWSWGRDPQSWVLWGHFRDHCLPGSGGEPTLLQTKQLPVHPLCTLSFPTAKKRKSHKRLVESNCPGDFWTPSADRVVRSSDKGLGLWSLTLLGSSMCNCRQVRLGNCSVRGVLGPKVAFEVRMLCIFPLGVGTGNAGLIVFEVR